MLNRTTVVMYHYTRRITHSRYPSIKGLELSLFEEQLKYLSKHYAAITIDELIYAYDDSSYKLPQNAVLMTFDDAYLDHYLHAYPLLKKYQMQGCFYAPAKVIEEQKLLDVNKIHFILAAQPNFHTIIADIKILFQQIQHRFDVKTFEQYQTELSHPNRFDCAEVIFIKRLLQVALPEEMRNHICSILFEKYMHIDEHVFSTELYMDKTHLSHMLSDGMHIGNHGYDHYWWNQLTAAQMHREIDQSLSFLDSLGVDTHNWTACYPYGSSSDEVVDILAQRQCKLAFTTIPDTVDIQQNHRLLIPRLDTNDLPKNANASFPANAMSVS